MSLIGLRRSHQQLAERLDANPLAVPVAAQSAPDSSNTPAAAPPSVPAAKNPGGKSNPILVPAPAPVPAPDPAPSSASFQSNPFFGFPSDTRPPQPLSTTIVVTTPDVVVVPAASSSSVVSSVVLPSSLSQLSSSSSLSSSSLSSSSTIVQTTPVVVATPSALASVSKTPTTFRNLPQTTFIPSVTSSAAPSPSASKSSGMSTGGIVGIAAASLAGVVLFGILGVYCLKRYFTSRDDDDDRMPSSSWMRNSVALPDDAPLPVSRGPSATPRPPTMIERKQTQNYANIGRGGYQYDQGGYTQDQGGYPQDQGGYAHNGYPQDNNMGYSGYQDSPYGVQPMPSFNPGQHIGPSAHQPFFSPIASPASPAAPSFDESMPPMQHASLDGTMGAPVYFSRRSSNMSGAQPNLSANLRDVPNPHDSTGPNGYADLNRSSVTAYQAQQYAAISRQLGSPGHPDSITENAAAIPIPGTPSTHEHSPFEDPAPAPAPAPTSGEEEYQELTIPSAVHHLFRVDSSPPMLPPMRTLSPVGGVGAQPSIIQIASAFPPTPMSPTFPSPAAQPGSPKASSFKQAPPLSPAPGAQGQIMTVPAAAHVGRETPVQFGFNEPVAVGSESGSSGSVEGKAERRVPNAKRMSVASKKSVAKSERPETMYDEEDAYGGI